MDAAEPSITALVRELTRIRCVFQMRSVLLAMGLNPDAVAANDDGASHALGDTDA